MDEYLLNLQKPVVQILHRLKKTLLHWNQWGCADLLWLRICTGMFI